MVLAPLVALIDGVVIVDQSRKFGVSTLEDSSALGKISCSN